MSVGQAFVLYNLKSHDKSSLFYSRYFAYVSHISVSVARDQDRVDEV